MMIYAEKAQDMFCLMKDYLVSSCKMGKASGSIIGAEM